jgi:hypothetical protein
MGAKVIIFTNVGSRVSAADDAGGSLIVDTVVTGESV